MLYDLMKTDPKNMDFKNFKGFNSYSILAILKSWKYSKTEKKTNKCILGGFMSFIMSENTKKVKE